MEQFLSRQQAADTLNVSTQTIDRMCKAGVLKSAKVASRRVGISADSLSRYVSSITDGVNPFQEAK